MAREKEIIYTLEPCNKCKNKCKQESGVKDGIVLHCPTGMKYSKK